MIDIWSIVQWWDDWQLRVLVLGSLGFQWFLLLAAPMRKYMVPQAFRTCIWLAYISSDALAIYALATLFNRHARTVPATYCAAPPALSKEQSRILEVLWAPILLIHLGGQEEMTAYEIEDNELWTRHTITLVSQVSVAIYAFYKSWHPASSDGKLTAVAVLLFVIGIVSFSEKPFALNRAKIKRLADVSAWIQGTKKRSVCTEGVSHFSLFEEGKEYLSLLPRLCLSSMGCCGDGKCGTSTSSRKKEVALSPGDKVLMVLSDMSLGAAAKELVERERAKKKEDVLPPLVIADKGLAHWLRGAFAFIYTRASVVVNPFYLVYHLALVPALHIAALALFAASDKAQYKRADVKITYVLLCLTAALDFFAVFVRQLLYSVMSRTRYPALCETVPRYNLIDDAVREADQYIGWMYRCARNIGLTCCNKEEFSCACACTARPRDNDELYKKVAATVLADLVNAQDQDLGSYRVLDDDSKNWALSKELQGNCGAEIRWSLGISFDRSVLLWHIATDLCFRCTDVVDDGHGEEKQGTEQAQQQKDAQEGEEGPESEEGGEESSKRGGKIDGGRALLGLYIKCTQAISNYMAHLLNTNPEMLLTGSRSHLISEARDGVKSTFLAENASDGCFCRCSCSYACCNGCSCSCGQLKRAHLFAQNDKDQLIPNPNPKTDPHKNEQVEDPAGQLRRAHHLSQRDKLKAYISDTADLKVDPTNAEVFHIKNACKLARELLEIEDEATRWKVMYRVWLGMLCYSASMCRGYLHAKSLGEGGEFLSFVWLVLSLKGAQTLADKLQMPPETNKPQASSSSRVLSTTTPDV